MQIYRMESADLKRNAEKCKEGYLPALLDEWDRVRLAILRKG